MSSPPLGPTQPPFQWVPGALSLGVSGRGVKLTTHFHLVPRLRVSGAIPPLLQYTFMAWCSVKAQNNFTFYILHCNAKTSVFVSLKTKSSDYHHVTTLKYTLII
jgi:hypothetical protein